MMVFALVVVIVLMIMLFVLVLHKINIVSSICTSCNLQCFCSDASDWLMQQVGQSTNERL